MNPNDPLHALPDDPEAPMALPGVGAPAEADQAVQARAAEAFAQPEEGTVAAQDAVPASTAELAQVVARLAGLRMCTGARQRGQRKKPPPAGARESCPQMWQLSNPAWRACRAIKGSSRLTGCSR